MGIDFDAEDDLPDPDADPDKIYKAKSKPFCSVHFCKMESIRSFKEFTSYRCVVPGCDKKVARMRPEFSIPAEPETCPLCSKRKTKVYLTVREMRTYNVRLECPNGCCKFYLDVPRPDIEQQIRRANRRA